MDPMDFESLDLDPVLLDALARLNLTTPTTIQQQAIPEAMTGRDVLASAPTGTGKTLAFLLPAVQHLLDFPRARPGPGRVLILTPTRELANQVAKQAKLLVRDTDLKVAVITGGMDYIQHGQTLKKTVDIVIATPGRLMEYIKQEVFECMAIETLILDEADRMLDMGFLRDVQQIADELTARRQTLLFSATLEGAGLEEFALGLMNDPIELSAEPSRRESGKIHQWVHLADNLAHKQQLLTHWLRQEEVERAIVFVKTRDRLTELVGYLQSESIDCAFLRGEMEQKLRSQALNRFRNGKVRVLVATDVAARGIDIPDVSHVFNFDLPRTAEVYVHRIGRTARAGNKGTAISLIEAHDMAILGKIERYTKQVLKARVIRELRPKHKAAKVSKKKKPKKEALSRVQQLAQKKAKKKAAAKKKKK